MSDLPIIILSPKLHRDDWKLFFESNLRQKFVTRLRKIHAKWSKTNQAWYLPYSLTHLNSIKEIFKSVAQIDSSQIVFKITNNKPLTTNN